MNYYQNLNIADIPFSLNLVNNWQLGFQPAATPIMEGIIHVHQEIMVIGAGILLLVTLVMFYILKTYTKKENFIARSIHAPLLEVLWTLIPCFILAIIGAPSMALLYSMDETFHPYTTIKVIGRQWYWTYKYSYDFKDHTLPLNDTRSLQNQIAYDSILLNDDQSFKETQQDQFSSMIDMMKEPADNFYTKIRGIQQKNLANSNFFYRKFHEWFLEDGKNKHLLTKENNIALWEEKHKIDELNACLEASVGLRQMKEIFVAKLSVDKPMIIPSHKHVRLLITSSDVIHSWAVPSFGVKMDAIPGRTNQVFVYSKVNGIFYGQCSELCGVNHAFMPVQVIVVPTEQMFKVSIMLLNDDSSSTLRLANVDIDKFFK